MGISSKSGKQCTPRVFSVRALASSRGNKQPRGFSRKESPFIDTAILYHFPHIAYIPVTFVERSNFSASWPPAAVLIAFNIFPSVYTSLFCFVLGDIYSFVFALNSIALCLHKNKKRMRLYLRGYVHEICNASRGTKGSCERS